MTKHWCCLEKNGLTTNVKKNSVCGRLDKSVTKTVTFYFVIFLLLPTNSCQRRLMGQRDECYDENRNPVFCQPHFENIALKKSVVVSETCGVPKTESYCKLLEESGHVTRVCDKCENSGSRAHPARHMTDINDNRNTTHWQSKTIRGRRKVTLKISFEKKYELFYISLQFQSPRPKSMIIYKSVNHGRTWTPFQFYAQNCLLRFGLPNHAHANQTGDHEALCLEDSSDPRPLSGGRVLFNTNKYRPSEGNFENSHVLQEWVTATDIKVVLTEVNPVEEILPPFSRGYTKRRAGGRTNKSRKSFLESLHNHHKRADSTTRRSRRRGTRRSAPAQNSGQPPSSVSQYALGSSQFYAINDVTIGGRCKCNGHASQCIMKKGRLVCDCRHNTDGTDCEKCKAFHLDRPWMSATRANPNECVGECRFISS